jgi:hypothetical protein
MSVNPREQPGKTRPFAVCITLDFSDEFFSEFIKERESEFVGCELETILVL